MSWTCQYCGAQEPIPPGRCRICGTVFLPASVSLTSVTTGRVLALGGPTVVGRTLLQRRLGDADAVYASERQFEVVKDEARGAWLVRHDPSARNQTYLDGAPVPAEGVVLAAGAVLSVGRGNMRMAVGLGT